MFDPKVFRLELIIIKQNVRDLMKTFALVIALILATLILPATAQQATYHIEGEGWFGCTTKELFDEISGYRVAGDKQAFVDAMTAGLMTGDCTMFEDGETVYLEDTSIWSGMVQVRRPGERLKYWTNFEAAKSDA
jgi:hypothetical protein